MPPSNRREFLKLAAVASLTAANAPFSWARPPARARAWVTSQDRRMEEIKPPAWRTVPAQGAAGIHIDTTKHYQEILGFGAAFTDASCYLLAALDEQKRGALLNDLLGPSGLRLSVGRTCIGASDYSRFAYTFRLGERVRVRLAQGQHIPILPDLGLEVIPGTATRGLESGRSVRVQRRVIGPGVVGAAL